MWVAEDHGALIGYAACDAIDDALHLWELAVRHDRQRQGVGRMLMGAVVDAARARRLPAVTLTTFREIPWNAPYYRALGFVDFEDDRLAALLAREAELGLDAANRCAMRLAV